VLQVEQRVEPHLIGIGIGSVGITRHDWSPVGLANDRLDIVLGSRARGKSAARTENLATSGRRPLVEKKTAGSCCPSRPSFFD